MDSGELCEVCAGEEPPKYTCPTCSKRTCSLACVKKHKEETGCTGKRARSTFIKVSEMNDESITVDDALLRDLQDKTGRAAQLEPPAKDTKTLGREGQFKWLLTERRLLVKCLPSDFSRHKANKTKIQRSETGRVIKWTLEVKSGDGYKRCIHDVDETLPLGSVLQDIGTAQVFVLDEGKKASGALNPLDPSLPLKDQLVDITIIEYPRLVIRPPVDS